jgi:pimeloyl-ACP methyl ester carboxylesterase
MLAASAGPAPWRALVAFEPPVPPPSGSALAMPFQDLHAALAAGAERRRTRFDDPGQLVRSFRRHRSFDRIGDAELDDLARATLRPAGEQRGYVLACERSFEAETFRLRDVDGAWDQVSSLDIPVTIVSSDPESGEPAVLPLIAEALAANGGYAHRRVPDSTHFLQIERPRECERIVRDVLSGLDSASEGGSGTPSASDA